MNNYVGSVENGVLTCEKGETRVKLMRLSKNSLNLNLNWKHQYTLMIYVYVSKYTCVENSLTLCTKKAVSTP